MGSEEELYASNPPLIGRIDQYGTTHVEVIRPRFFEYTGKTSAGPQILWFSLDNMTSVTFKSEGGYFVRFSDGGPPTSIEGADAVRFAKAMHAECCPFPLENGGDHYRSY